MHSASQSLSCPSLTQRPPAAGNQDVVDDFLQRKQQAAAYRARALGQDHPPAPYQQWPQPARVGGAGARPIGQAAPSAAAQPVPDRRSKAEKVCVWWTLLDSVYEAVCHVTISQSKYS